jgi:hypothetical protein
MGAQLAWWGACEATAEGADCGARTVQNHDIGHGSFPVIEGFPKAYPQAEGEGKRNAP